MSSLQPAPIEEFVDVIASEIANGAAVAVERWMAEIESALTDPRLTSLGRLNAVGEVVARYKWLTGKSELYSQRERRAG